jgi:hypothetical protein
MPQLATGGSRRYIPVRTEAVTAFPFGTIDTIEEQSIPQGAASASQNWLTYGDHIELRRGYQLLGTENVGSGEIQNTGIAERADGTQVLFRKNGQKLQYYSTATSDWVEVGTNIFPAAALNDYASFANYASLAGNQFFVCSPNAGPFKIMVANPGNYTDLTDSAHNFQGYMKIKQNRMMLWGRTKDKTGVYGSYIDAAAYTTVSGEATTSLSGTLAFKAAGALRTCFAVSITLTGSGEVYTDDYNGNLNGSLGGTGTINYTTGAYTLSNSGVGTATYQWENSNNTGITDFTKSSPRTAGQGFVFRQDDGGGALMNVLSYGDVEYCIHETKTWALTLTATDTNATNLIYRDRVGIPNWQASCETGSGIFYIDDTDQADPQIRLLTLNRIGTDVIPVSISKARKLNAEGTIVGLDLSNYRFDKAVMREWGDFVILACRYKDSSKNDTLITYNKLHGSLDKHTLSASSLVVYNGTLVCGDSVSSNNYTLFSGFDDDDSLINNSWEGSLSDFGTDYIKKVKKFIVQGKIQASQSFDIYVALDSGSYSLVGSISGSGTYVDAGNPFLVGTETIGSHVIGDGGDGVNAFNYEHILVLKSDKFNRIKLKFVATGIGFLTITMYKWFDIRLYAKKELIKYR